MCVGGGWPAPPTLYTNTGVQKKKNNKHYFALFKIRDNNIYFADVMRKDKYNNKKTAKF